MGEITLLLGTHIFLWWLFDDPHLPQGIRDAISKPANNILVSSASVWEIATKYRLGKLPEAEQVRLEKIYLASVDRELARFPIQILNT